MLVNSKTGSHTVGVAVSQINAGINSVVDCGIWLVADPANSGSVFFGTKPYLTAASKASTDGFLITATPFLVDVDSFDQLWFIASEEGQKFFYFAR